MSLFQILSVGIFWLIACLGLVMVGLFLFRPALTYPRIASITGLNLNNLIHHNPHLHTPLKKLLQWIGSILMGGNFMTLFLAVMAFYHQHWLAWWALWYWPVMFLWHF